MKSFLTLILICFFSAGCQSVPVKKVVPEQGNAQKPKAVATSGPRHIYATNTSFDMSTGGIKYTLPEAGLVQIRIGIKEGGPMLRTLLDWEERSAGEHEEIWDRKDATGQIDFRQRRDLMLVLICIPKDSHARKPVFKGFKKSPKFNITFPDSQIKDDQGVPIVSGVTSVRIRLDENDKTWLAESKYEIALFIDNVFLMEDEEGMNPFTYKLDTKSLNDGVHSLTVNLVVYDGEIGTASAFMMINNQKPMAQEPKE